MFSRLPARPQQVVVALCALVLAYCCGLNWSHWNTTKSPPLFEPAPALAAHPQTKRTTVSHPVLMVHVVGAVHRPGVLTFGDGARVVDAVRQAGGSTRRADLQAINLAARLHDGEQIIVPSRGEHRTVGPAFPTAARASKAASAGGRGGKKLFAGKLKVNTASLNELLQLPGVGPSTAARIAAYRVQHGAFHSLEDLHAVKGLGPKKLEKLRDHVLF